MGCIAPTHTLPSLLSVVGVPAAEVVHEGLLAAGQPVAGDALLQKQNEVLALLAQRHQQEYLLLINLVSKYAKQEDKDKPKLDKDIVDQILSDSA